MLAKLSTAFINSDRRFPMSDNAWFQQLRQIAEK